jgi:hypothetical protein
MVDRASAPTRIRCADGVFAEITPLRVPADWLRIPIQRDYYGAGALSYVMRVGAGGQLSGAIYGNVAASGWDALAALGQSFAAIVQLASRDPEARLAELAAAGTAIRFGSCLPPLRTGDDQ